MAYLYRMAKLDLDGRSENSVALDTGIALSTLRRRIADPASLTMSELVRLAEALDRTPAELLHDVTGGRQGSSAA